MLLYLTRGADQAEDGSIHHGDGTGGELAVHTHQPGVLVLDIEGGARESGEAVLVMKQVKELCAALESWLAANAKAHTKPETGP